MRNREWLNAELRKICPNVYYKAPKNVNFQYPCIKYKETGIENVSYSDNMPYSYYKSYEVIAMSIEPDTDIADRILLAIPYADPVRSYEYKGVYHYVFKIKI